MSQANLYGFGRLAWNPDLTTKQIAEEWTRLTFGSDKYHAKTDRGGMAAPDLRLRPRRCENRQRVTTALVERLRTLHRPAGIADPHGNLRRSLDRKSTRLNS